PTPPLSPLSLHDALPISPLAFTGLAAAAAFRMRLFNIGAEGQLYIGAITAAATGLYLGGNRGPSAFVIAAMVVAGCAGGALWGLDRKSTRLNSSHVASSY